MLGATTGARTPWYQVNLRALLLATGLIALCLSPLGRDVARANQQRVTVRELRIRGALISYQTSRYPEWLKWLFGEDLTRRVTSVRWVGPRPVQHKNSVTHLAGGRDSRITKEELPILLRLSDIESLCMAGAPITDAELQLILKLPQLRRLDLRGTLISDAGIQLLHGYHGLEEVDVRGTAVSPQALNGLELALPDCKVRR